MAWAVEKLSSSQDELFWNRFKKNTAMDELAHTGHPLDGILHKGIPPYGYAIIPAARPARPSLALDEFFWNRFQKQLSVPKKHSRGHGNQWAGPALAVTFHAK